jgi:ubiquinone/menaquinone biosynthesis C-methylase UbiE
MARKVTVDVAPANREQAAAWDGAEGAYWADNAQRYDDAVARQHQRLMAALDLADDTRALDVGCGTGQETRAVAARCQSGSALGVDLSSRMLDIARREATRSGLANVSFKHADAQIYPFFRAAFDVVLSRTAAMFFGDKPAAFANLARALRPNGQLAILVWQAAPRNEWFIRFMTALAAGRAIPQLPPAGPNPFSMADPDRVRPLLVGAGFYEVKFEPVDEPTYWGADADDAYAFVIGQLGWMLQGLDESGRRRAQDALRESLDRHRTPEGVRYASAAWLITTRRA